MPNDPTTPAQKERMQTAIGDFEFQVCSRCGHPPSDGPCIMGNEEHAETWPKRYASYVVTAEVAQQLQQAEARAQTAEAELEEARRGNVPVVVERVLTPRGWCAFAGRQGTWINIGLRCTSPVDAYGALVLEIERLTERAEQAETALRRAVGELEILRSFSRPVDIQAAERSSDWASLPDPKREGDG